MDIVFQELQNHQLFINGKKSELFLEEIHYLGHIISKEGIRMDPAKVMAIKEWPELKTVHEVHGYFTKYIAPLHDLTKKYAIFH